MHRRRNNERIVEAAEKAAAVLAGFDFRIDNDDFILHELARLIEEDRASFDDEEFRRLVDAGVRTHIEEDLQVRADLAGVLRYAAHTMDADARVIAMRVVHALEDVESDLRNAGTVIRAYTAHLFDKLANLPDASPAELSAQEWIRRWRNGEIDQERLAAELKALGSPAVGPAADILFKAPEDRHAATAAIDLLAAIGSAPAARVLAHIVSEPMLDEDLEERAFAALRGLWPLARPYVVYDVARHDHEDLPARWFQLLIETDDAEATDLVLEELRVHGADSVYHEDLSVLFELLLRSRDPEIQDRILDMMNDPRRPPAATSLLQDFLKRYIAPDPKTALPERRREFRRLKAVNDKYKAAAKLFDAGRRDEARQRLDEILALEPGYPFAVMLRSQF